MRRPELPVVSFLCIALLLCSLPSHIRAGSVATISMIVWLAVMSLIRGVNALLWADNFEVKAQVWCDISTKITIGFTYAVPAAALCILRHLESVASTRNVLRTKDDKRRRQVFEACMCFGVPIVFMALHYVVQGHRYDLFEDFGCYPAVYFSIASIIIIWVPPLIMSMVTFVYAALSLRHFLQHRIEFAAHLQNSQSAISPGRYLRLMAMAVVEMIWDTGINSYIIWFNSVTGLRPWISWDDVHSNFSRVGVFPQFLNPPAFLVQLIWQWWIVPISCFLFFIFFAFGEEAMSDYRAVFNWLRRIVLRQNIPKPTSYETRFALPIQRPRIAVDAANSTTSYDASEDESKAWDQLSLKMPGIVEPAIVPPNTTSVTELSQSGPLPLTGLKDPSLSSYDSNMASLPLAKSPHSASIYTVESSSLVAEDSISHTSIHEESPHRPESKFLHRMSVVTPSDSDFVTIPPAAVHDDVSVSPSRPPGYLKSMQSDSSVVNVVTPPGIDVVPRNHNVLPPQDRASHL